MKSSKMKKFEEKEIKNLSSLNLNETELESVKGGISISLDWKGWFDGSFFGRLFDGIRGNAEINEFD